MANMSHCRELYDRRPLVVMRTLYLEWCVSDDEVDDAIQLQGGACVVEVDQETGIAYSRSAFDLVSWEELDAGPADSRPKKPRRKRKVRK